MESVLVIGRISQGSPKIEKLTEPVTVEESNPHLLCVKDQDHQNYVVI